MMKKIFLLVLGFVMFKVGYSQYPIQQYIGADSAVVTSKGGLQGRLINQVFADTTAANSQRIKQYPGAMIYASGKLWLRNSTATGWSEIAQGQISNIYNSNGTLTGSRELDGNGYPLLFTAVRKFQVSADTVDFLPFNGQLFSNLNQGSGTKAVRYNPSTRLFTYADTTSSLSGYVPYTGATQNVNLGQYGLKTEYVEFDTTLRAPADRTLSWSNDDGTLYLGMTNGGTITQRIGLEQFARVKNVDTVAITKGEAVYIFGASGDRAAVKRASNKGDGTSSKTLGVAAENIAVNSVGLVGTFGVVQNLNLGAYTAGDILYLDSIPGQLTATKPQAPYHIVFVGVVERANAGNGLLFVNPQNGYELDELHNVLITSPVYNKSLLIYDSINAIWVDTTYAAAGLGPTGSGTTNYIPKWTSSTALGNSVAYDDGTNIGIGTASPAYKLDVSGDIKTSGLVRMSNSQIGQGATSTAAFGIRFNVNSYEAISFITPTQPSTDGCVKFVFSLSGRNYLFNNNTSNDFMITGDASRSFLIGTGTTAQFAKFGNGNVVIGTSPVDAGYRLDVVNGNVRFKGTGADVNTTLFRVENSSSLLPLTYKGNGELNVGGSILFNYLGAGNFYTSNVDAYFTGYFSRENLRLGFYGGVTVNDGSDANVDFRVESDNNANLLFTKASTDNIGIGTNAPNSSAILHISSTTKGFLPPVMTGAQAEAIGTPTEGLMVYANNGNGTTITSTGWWGYNGTTWVKLN